MVLIKFNFRWLFNLYDSSCNISIAQNKFLFKSDYSKNVYIDTITFN